MNDKTEKPYETRWNENGEPKSERFGSREEAFAKMREVIVAGKEFVGVWNHEPTEARARRMAAERSQRKGA